jgi:hypothetical protein
VQVQVSSRYLPTLNALKGLGSGSATEVSKVTGKSRAFESKNLNELFGRGFLCKQLKGRRKIFSLKEQA